jgi:hypothetical protein
MKTTAAACRMFLNVLLFLIAGTAFAGLRETASQGWQTTMNGSRPTPKDNTALPPGIKSAADNKSMPGEIVVKLRKTSQAATVLERAVVQKKESRLALAETNELSGLLHKHRMTSAGAVFGRARRETGSVGIKAKTEKDMKRDGLFRWCRLQVPSDVDLKQALADLKANPAVEYAEPAIEWQLNDGVEPPITGLPNGSTDPQINQQWHLTAVKAQAAWNYLKDRGVPAGGNRDVVVAVIDTGVDYNHEDLIGNMWTNPREIPGNNIDDDANGFVDDIHGCSVVSDARSHAGDPIDLHGHGTHVSGVIAATAFNLKGGVGVAFNVQIMAIRAAQYSGALTSTDIAEAILYAADNGAEVINMSFGGYQRSQVVEDVLEMALNQAVLVAAAGNDGLNAYDFPSYPAALPYVHGVMAASSEGTRAWFSNYGYDLAAPGEDILSTLPGNQYAAWSGTSMATPVVSGIAALMRSYFWQRDIYSSRFLMGGLWNCANPNVDALKAISELPAPGVNVLETWLFDNQAISERNDADGKIDSGETLHLAVEVMNRCGQAENVVATLKAQAEGAAFEDPYVTILTNAVNFGDIGPFNTTDNGFIYNAGGVITGVERPFVIQVASNCPNDHVIEFEMTVTYEDGWNPSVPGPYESVSRFRYVVQRGKNVPRVISTNTVLAADEFWMVASPVLVEQGATLTIEAGAQVQWGGISDDPYNPGPQAGNMIVRGNLRVEGTSEQPVSFFPSYLVAGQLVNIAVDGGTADMAYVKVRNPNLTGFRNIDHVYFDWDFGASTITAEAINNSVFHKLRGGGTLSAAYFNRCLFDAGWLAPSGTPRLFNCAFLQDNENNHPLSLTVPKTTDKHAFGGVYLGNYNGTEFTGWRGIHHVVTRSNDTYALLPVESTTLQEAELIAQYFGGHVASITNEEEQAFLEGYVNQMPGVGYDGNSTFIGMTDDPTSRTYGWLDGAPTNYTHWSPNYPIVLPKYSKHVVSFSCLGRYAENYLGTWRNSEIVISTRGGYGGISWGLMFILKLPGSWTEPQLNAPVTSGELLTYVRERMRGDVRYNAFLSKYWDPNVSHWMRIMANNYSPRRTYAAMFDNYWGTDMTGLIDYAIKDYVDDFVSSQIEYQPAAAHGFTTTYPFAERVLINGVTAETVPQLSGGRADFTISFNRDMNTNIEPYVTFGPSAPHTDFSVTPRDVDFHEMTNGWLNARTWQGSAWITPVTGEGYQLMRISGAVAADDPWLVSGYDVGRFRFEVRTMEVLAMTLQAVGQEGSIQLTWQQNDYDLLAGYNLYRADSTNGTWTRLNDTVIPPGSESYADTNVPPAVRKYYRFTVLTTDMTESDPSGLASASALDTIAPVLTHMPITSALPARGLRISATATDNLRVTDVTLFYRLSGSGSNFTGMAMVNVISNDWAATIPGSVVLSPGVDYYITAGDGISEVFSGTPVLPHVVFVNNVPSLTSVTPNHGPGAGGTVVTLGGTLFESGVSVLFGGVLASNITLMSGNQLTCVTPAHFPALVDVTVVNTNGMQSTLLSAFQFEQSGVLVAMPVTNGTYGAQVEVALSAANVEGLRAVDATLAFDPTVLSAVDARVGALTAGWALSANLGTPGRAVVSLANASSVSGSGPLVILRFNVIKAPPASSALTIESVSLNDGAMTATCSDGELTVNGFFSLAGAVRYFSDSKAVPETAIALAGAGNFLTLSATNGTFSITNVPTAGYVMTPTKTNDVVEITGYDASLVLQAAAGLLVLSSNQVLAADVNRNGIVSSMDASYILEKSVGLIEGAFPGAGCFWEFTPAQRSYGALVSDLSGQDFTAILIGDVSGNWLPPAGKGVASSGFKGQGVGVVKTSDETETTVITGMDNGPLPGGNGEQSARVLLKATEASVYSVDLVLNYDPTNRTVAEVNRGSLAGSMALAVNTNQEGVVRVSLAGANPVAGNGSLIVMKFAGGDPVLWQISQVRINEGMVSALPDASLAAFDTDGDELLDVDEIELFNTDIDRGDTDGDKAGDGAEVRAGTDPRSKEDVFAVVKTDSIGELNRVVWSVKGDKSYQVMKSFDLQLWTNAPTGMGADQQSLRTAITNGLLNYIDPETDSNGLGPIFYRIRLVE